METSFKQNNKIENVFLRLPHKYKSRKTIKARKCNNLAKNNESDTGIYLTVACINTTNWKQILAVLACSSCICIVDTLLEINDCEKYAMPEQPKNWWNRNTEHTKNSKLPLFEDKQL